MKQAADLPSTALRPTLTSLLTCGYYAAKPESLSMHSNNFSPLGALEKGLYGEYNEDVIFDFFFQLTSFAALEHLQDFAPTLDDCLKIKEDFPG